MAVSPDVVIRRVRHTSCRSPRFHTTLGRRTLNCPLMLHRNRQLTHILAALGVVAACLGLGGCAGPLLSQDDTRSQFDRYDSLRNQHSEQYIFDERGARKPNLADRLSPKD